MDVATITALLPLAEKLLSNLAGGLNDASPDQKNALSEVFSGLLGKISSASTGNPQSTAIQFGADSQIMSTFKAIADGHTIELDMTLKIKPKVTT